MWKHRGNAVFSRTAAVLFGLLLISEAWRMCVGGTRAMSEEQKMIGENSIPNPSFEEVVDGKPAGWNARKESGRGRLDYVTEGRDGGRCALMESEQGGDQALEAAVPVKPFSTYRLSGWIRTEDVVGKTGRGAFIGVAGKDVQTPALTGTNDWTRVEILFDTGKADTQYIQCVLGGGGLATGRARERGSLARAWFDDLALELVSTQRISPAIIIDTTKTGAPISKYIYGQFIEHLGRCIYGGIWAEMLEDRKFFYPVGDKESPWEPAGGVTMVTAAPYVGEHTPEISRGMFQRGLGLRTARTYVGRIVMAGRAGAGPVEVTLSWGPGPEDKAAVTIGEVAPEYRTTSFTFTAGGDADDGQLSIVCKGMGPVRVGAVSLMPADNVRGMRADTLALLKELDAPVYRWPGGNFVSGYNWTEGTGDPDRRPPRKNPAWQGVEHNDFGFDEFMTFCRELNTDPLVVVNSGLGDMTLAVDEMEYANGSAETPMGKRRAENGHTEPYGVKWWGIGNEMYGKWQLGHIPLGDYVKRHNEFADALRAKDPSIKLIAVGATGPWSEAMLSQCAGHMDLLSEHFYCHEQPGVLSHVQQIPDSVRFKADNHRRYHQTIPALAGKTIPIALDEWNYWYGPHLYGELGTRYFLKDALGIAAGLHEMTRASDLFFMANYAQTVNVIGAIKTTKTDAAFDTTGLVLKLYRHCYGTVPVEVSGESGALDVAAAWTSDRKALTLGIVNPTDEQMSLRFAVAGAALTGRGRCWTIAGADPMAYNEPGKPLNVSIVETAVADLKDVLDITPLSVSLYELAVR